MNVKQKISAGIKLAQIRLSAPLSPAFAAKKAFQLFCTPLTRTILPISPLFKSAEQLRFDYHGLSITGYRWNKGGSRKILIVHGHKSTVNNFELLIGLLLDQNAEVLAFDAPAHGRSEGKQLNALEYRDFIKTIFTRYGPFTGALAHSFGGLAIAMALAEWPHDGHFRLVLIGPATKTTTTIRLFLQQIKQNSSRMQSELDMIIKNISGQDTAWFSIPRTLEQLQAGILWVHDEDDRITPYEDVKAIQENPPSQVYFFITKGLGHSKIYRDPEVGKAIALYLR